MTAHITTFLDTWAERLPAKAAIVFGSQTTTWQQLRERVSRLAGALQQQYGLKPGSKARVFVLDKNHAATIELTLACAWAGITCVVGNFRLAPEEIVWTVNDSTATVLFVGRDFAPAIEKVRAQLKAVTAVVNVGGEADHYESLLAKGQPVERAAFQPDDCFLQLYTSGTTGFPKGAMLTHASMHAHTENMVPLFDFHEKSVAMVPMPLFHVGGSSWAMLAMRVGATSVVMRDPIPKLLLETIQAQKVTHTFIVPALLQAFMAMPDFGSYDTSSLVTLVYGASPISVPLLEQCLAKLKCQFFQVYGMTEVSGVFCALDDAAHRDTAHRERLASAGKPTRGVQFRIVDPATGKDVPKGQLGEFWAKTDQLMAGYWNQPQATAEAITPDGWLKTGDAGIVDEGGFYFITDRVKDMVISGGENVYPAEVERVLQQHPAIADVAVFGVPHEKWGETLRAAVVVRPGKTLSEPELISFAREKLAGYKCPTSAQFIDALPRNPSGKVLKRELRAPFWVGRERTI